MKSEQKATLSFSDGTPSIEMPIYKGTVGPDVIDIRKIYGQTGKFTFDPGFMSTAACESKITYIDGDKGELIYRGYPIEVLAQNCDHLEVCYLLLYGELPTAAERAQFGAEINNHSMVHEQMHRFFTGFRRDAHPMAVLVAVIGALAAFYHETLDITDPESRRKSAIRVVAKIPTLMAMAYKYSVGEPFRYPRFEMSFAANIMQMMFGSPCEDYVQNEVLVRALDRILILHADHEQNASTSTVRLAGSSGANPFACISAGISTLWGPAHGGANEACLVMLNKLLADGGVSKIGDFIKQVKDKDSGVKLMGFGHRVYKNYDPRAKLMRESCHEVLSELGLHDDPLFAIAMKLEQIALEDDYFVSRKLYPNVDYYSGIVQKAMGIPVSMFTCMFAVSRTVGWISQWNEMIAEPDQKIGRPRQLFTGYPTRDFIPVDKR